MKYPPNKPSPRSFGSLSPVDGTERDPAEHLPSVLDVLLHDPVDDIFQRQRSLFLKPLIEASQKIALRGFRPAPFIQTADDLYSMRRAVAWLLKPDDKKAFHAVLPPSEKWILALAQEALRDNDTGAFHEKFADFYCWLKKASGIGVLTRTEQDWRAQARFISDQLIAQAHTLKRPIRLNADAKKTLSYVTDPQSITSPMDNPAFHAAMRRSLSDLIMAGAHHELTQKELTVFSRALGQSCKRFENVNTTLSRIFARNVMAGPGSLRHEIGPGFVLDRLSLIDRRFLGKKGGVTVARQRQRNLDRLIDHIGVAARSNRKQRAVVGAAAIQTIRYALLPMIDAHGQLRFNHAQDAFTSILDGLGRRPDATALDRAWSDISLLAQQWLMAVQNDADLLTGFMRSPTIVGGQKKLLTPRADYKEFADPITTSLRKAWSDAAQKLSVGFKIAVGIPLVGSIVLAGLALFPDTRPMLSGAVKAAFERVDAHNDHVREVYEQQFWMVETGLIAYLQDRAHVVVPEGDGITAERSYGLFHRDPLMLALQQYAPDFYETLRPFEPGGGGVRSNFLIITPRDFTQYVVGLEPAAARALLEKISADIPPAEPGSRSMLDLQMQIENCLKRFSDEQQPAMAEQAGLGLNTFAKVLTGVNPNEIRQNIEADFARLSQGVKGLAAYHGPHTAP